MYDAVKFCSIERNDFINLGKWWVDVRSRRMHRRWQTTAALRMRLLALAWNMKIAYNATLPMETYNFKQRFDHPKEVIQKRVLNKVEHRQCLQQVR